MNVNDMKYIAESTSLPEVLCRLHFIQKQVWCEGRLLSPICYLARDRYRAVMSAYRAASIVVDGAIILVEKDEDAGRCWVTVDRSHAMPTIQ